MLNEQEQPKSQVSVLFVDDEKNVISALNRLFRRTNYKVHTALSAKQGLEILENNEIHIVVSDMQMPEMFGDEFLEIVSKTYPSTVRLLLTGYADLTSTINAINKGKINTYISKPWDDNYLKTIISQAAERIFLAQEKERLEILTKQQNELLTQMNEQLEQKVAERTSELQNTLQDLQKSNDKVKKNFVDFVKVFSSFVELRDPKSVGHSRNVGRLCYKFALYLGMSEKNAQDLLFAGMLHDVGRISLSDELLNKNKSELTTADQTILQSLPLQVCDILMGLEYLHNSVKYINNYQEHYDGSGYPNKLSAEDIPIESRVLLIVNDYDEYINCRKYSPQQACETLIRSKNKKYDAKLLSSFFAFLDSESKSSSKQVTDHKVKTLTSGQLIPNMILLNDVISQNGLILFPQGFKFNQESIESIRKYEKRSDEKLSFDIKL